MRVNDPARTPRRLRLWPAGLILGLAVVALAYVQLAVEGHRQRHVLLSAAVIVLTALLLVVWLLFLSGMRLRQRLLGFALVLAALGAMAALVTVRGVSGDLVPVLDWRFGRAPDGLPAPGVGAPARPSAGPVAPEAAGYPQYLGPSRDGSVSGPALARDWESDPPELLWRQPVGAGWSGFAIQGEHAVTQEQRGNLELVTCYDLISGALRWSHSDPARHDDPLGGVGPRSTPTIADGRVFAQGATGLLNVLDLYTGRQIWSTDVLDDAGAPRPEYGLSSSPLVLETQVVVFAGGGGGSLLIAYDRDDGQILWRAGDDPGSYGSPLLAHLAGREQILILGGADLSGHDPATGRVLWEYPWSTGVPRAAQPVSLPGDRVLISSGYDIGSRLLQIGPEPDVKTIWKSRDLKAKFSNIVHRDGYLYGLDDGILVAVGVEDGRRAWKGGRYGHGQLILAGDLLVVQSERGAVALVEATPAAHRELSRLDALDSKTWNNPALAGPYLVVRNDLEAACYRLPLRG